MIIDAMDLLYSGRVDGFCLCTSDSDFTRLATRLREAWLSVYGMWEKKTPKPFIVACDKFIYIEILKKPIKEIAKSKKVSVVETIQDQFDTINTDTINLIQDTVSDLADDDGWAFLGDVGGLLQKKQPNFDSRNYGYSKLTPLLASTGLFEIAERNDGKSRYKLIYVRNVS